MPQNEDPAGLNLEAWETWLEYRAAIKKPLREPSWRIAKRKMAEMGKHQMAAVENSIANGYQGLFLPHNLQDGIDPDAPW